MHRRRYLATTGATLTAATFAGCLGSGDGGSDPEPETSTTSSTTTEPTPTTTSEPEAPEITASSLLTGWQDFGDVLDEQVSGVGKGANAIVGFRYQANIIDGSVDTTEQVRVFGPDDNRVGLEEATDDQLVDGEGRQDWEHALYFDTASWDLGDYSYEVLVRNNATGEVSDTAEGTFSVVEPLGPQEATISGIDAPDSIATGETYSFTLEFSNVSDRDSSIVSPISAKYESVSEWSSASDDPIWCNVAEGESNTWTSGEVTYDTPGTIEFRIDAIDETWTVTVEDE